MPICFSVIRKLFDHYSIIIRSLFERYSRLQTNLECLFLRGDEELHIAFWTCNWALGNTYYMPSGVC